MCLDRRSVRVPWHGDLAFHLPRVPLGPGTGVFPKPALSTGMNRSCPCPSQVKAPSHPPASPPPPKSTPSWRICQSPADRSNYWLWESEPYVEASGWILDFGRLQPRLLCRWGRVELGGRAASRGQQVTVDLKSKQHPMRESSAPAIPPFCSQPPLPLYRLKETTLQSAAEASPSSELREDAVWWRQREKCQTIEGLCGSPWGWCPDIGDSSDPGGRCCPQLGLRVCPSAPWTGKSGCRGGPALLQPRALLVPAWSAPAEVLGQGGERCEDQGNGCLN